MGRKLLDGQARGAEIQVERLRIDVGKDRTGSAAHDGAGRGEEGERRGQHQVAGTNPGGGHGQPQGIRAAGAGDGVIDPEKRRDFPFERGNLFAENQALRLANPVDGLANFGANGCVLPLEIEQRHRLVAGRRSPSAV